MSRRHAFSLPARAYRLSLSLLALLLGSSLAARAQVSTVLLETEKGAILLEINETAAPITARNFLRYIEENRFEEATFFRTVTMQNQPNDSIKIEVIQGGFEVDEENLLPPIPHETTETTGLHHTDGAVSMARSEPGTARTSFFICIGDQLELDFGGKRNPDGQGFAAFGKVIAGMDVVRAIQQQPAEDQRLAPPVKITRVTVSDS